MIEMLAVFIVFGLVAAIGVRSLGETLQHDKPSKAANLFAADLEGAFSMAARQRMPIKIHLDSTNRIYHIEDRTDTTIKFKNRNLSTGDREIGFMSWSPSTITIMPSGLATAPLTATFGYVGSKGTYRNIVTVSRTGLVQVNGK